MQPVFLLFLMWSGYAFGQVHAKTISMISLLLDKGVTLYTPEDEFNRSLGFYEDRKIFSVWDFLGFCKQNFSSVQKQSKQNKPLPSMTGLQKIIFVIICNYFHLCYFEEWWVGFLLTECKTRGVCIIVV